MSKYRVLSRGNIKGSNTKSSFYYKFFFYSLALTSVNVGICSAYLKRKKEEWKEKNGNNISSIKEKKKISFFLTKDDFEILEKEKYLYKINKVCTDFHIPISHFSKAVNNYYPLDFHLQYIHSLFENFEKKKTDLQKIIENKHKDKDKNENENKNKQVLDILIEEIQKHFEKHLKDNRESNGSLFLENIDFTNFKEFLLKRKNIDIKKSNTLLNDFIDETYTYIYLYLLTNYKRNNFFDFLKVKRSYRHCTENSGQDIGLEVNSYLNFELEEIKKEKEKEKQKEIEKEKEKEKERAFYFEKKKKTNKQSTEIDLEKKNEITDQIKKEKEKENFVENTKYVLKIDKVNEITKSLKEYGVVVLKNFFPKEEINKIKKELFIDEKDSNISSYLYKKDQNIFCIRPTRGRQYCIIRNSKISDSFVNIQQYWLNILYAYLPLGTYENIFNFLNKENIFEKTQLENMSIKQIYNDKIYLSELQLIHNEPLSEVQTFHVDNGLNGLSLIIPLDKINEESGNWEFVLGSHNFSSLKKKKWKTKIQNLKKFLNIYYKTNSCFIPEIEETDLVIYDSKIIHRGLSNNLWKKNSSLIYRYDYKKYPPPGQDFVDIFGYNIIGKCVSFFNFLEKYF